MYHIAVVEDDCSLRTELKVLLSNALYKVTVIETFSQVSEQILSMNPDLVLLDLSLPNEDGITICSKIRKKSEIPIIFVTSNSTSMTELNCIMMGGDDFIAKPYHAPILIARISAVLKRTKKEVKSAETIMTHKGLSLDVVSAKIASNGQEEEVSKTELKILYYLMLHKNEMVSRADLIDYLWDNQVFIDDNTLSVNVTRIRSKLEQIGIHNYIETKRGLGYRI